jgi:hypothetical protein
MGCIARARLRIGPPARTGVDVASGGCAGLPGPRRCGPGGGAAEPTCEGRPVVILSRTALGILGGACPCFGFGALAGPGPPRGDSLICKGAGFEVLWV